MNCPPYYDDVLPPEQIENASRAALLRLAAYSNDPTSEYYHRARPYLQNWLARAAPASDSIN